MPAPKNDASPADPSPADLRTVLTRTLRTTRGGRFAADTLGGVRAVIHGFRGERISLRAAALTYISIFSLIPLLTVTLVLLESLHQEQFHLQMQGFIDELLAPGVRHETGVLLKAFIDRASSAAAGGIGFVILAITGGMLLKNLDASLNEIWNVRRKRAWHVRLVSYAFVLLLGPILVALTLAGSATVRDLLMQSGVPVVSKFTAYGSMVIAITAFTVLYWVVPNAPVRLRSAVAGGLLAGVAWDVAKLGYTAFGAQIFRYNPVYGSLGAAPLFLAWIYVSWLIILFGARLAYAVEHAVTAEVIRELGDHPRARELVATRVAQEITFAQVRGLPPPTLKELARVLDVAFDRMRDIAERLERNGLVVTGAREGLLPARLPDQITVADLSEAVGGLPPMDLSISEKEEGFQGIDELFARNDVAARRVLKRVSWLDLIRDRLGETPADAPTQAAATPSRRNP